MLTLLYGSGSKFKLCGSTVYLFLHKMVFNDDPRFCLPVNSREYVEMPHFAQYIYTSLCFVRYSTYKPSGFRILKIIDPYVFIILSKLQVTHVVKRCFM